MRGLISTLTCIFSLFIIATISGFGLIQLSLYAGESAPVQMPGDNSAENKTDESKKAPNPLDVRTLPPEHKKETSARPPENIAEKTKKETAGKIIKTDQDHKLQPQADENSEKKGAILISPSFPSANISFEGWREKMSFREVENWARSFGLKALRPEVTGEGMRASFISKYGSKVYITNLDPLRRYYLWIHFINYARLTESDINALLAIRADNEHIARLSFDDTIDSREPFAFEIPYHLTMDGKLTIELREYSSSGGFFGIWNMALTNSVERPEVFSAQKSAGTMIEPNSLIDAEKLTQRHKRKIPAKDKASIATPEKNIESTSEKKTEPDKKQTARDVRERRKSPHSKDTAIGNSIKKQSDVVQSGKSTKKTAQQKEIQAKKMLEEDRKKDIRTQ